MQDLGARKDKHLHMELSRIHHHHWGQSSGGFQRWRIPPGPARSKGEVACSSREAAQSCKSEDSPNCFNASILLLCALYLGPCRSQVHTWDLFASFIVKVYIQALFQKGKVWHKSLKRATCVKPGVILSPVYSQGGNLFRQHETRTELNVQYLQEMTLWNTEFTVPQQGPAYFKGHLNLICHRRISDQVAKECWCLPNTGTNSILITKAISW